MLKRPYGATGSALKGFVFRVKPDTNRQTRMRGPCSEGCFNAAWALGRARVTVCVPETPVDDSVNERSWNLGPQLHVGPAWASG